MADLRKNISNLLGWRTNRKIVVFESDDWGSIRTRSLHDYQAMLKKGLNVDENFFTRFDCFESNDDLERLFNLLSEFKDMTGRFPVFTPMCIVANPDFQRIRDSGFRTYHYKTLEETALNYPNHNKLFHFRKTGIDERLFVPALHGREHLNVRRYLQGLRDSTNAGLKVSFEHESIGANKFKGKEITEYLGAFYSHSYNELIELQSVMRDAVRLFQDVYGYSPTHFIGPNREPMKELDETLAAEGVKYITQSKIRRYPRVSNKHGYEFNWWGKMNKHNQTYIMRNAYFEPSNPNTLDSISACLEQIANAFKWKKPAVISTHRVNYIGSIVQKNSDNGLKELRILIKKVIQTWPDVEFMTSTELGNLINKV